MNIRPLDFSDTRAFALDLDSLPEPEITPPYISDADLFASVMEDLEDLDWLFF